MSLLLSAEALVQRATLSRGPDAPLAALALALAEGIEPLIGHEATLIPALSAQLSREGGRCAHDGSLLDFDPWNPAGHGCPRCGAVYRGERHDRHWLYWYHLWLAERALHAAVLWRLHGNARHRDCALALLAGYTATYPTYLNRDNLLGPSRVFFSTYLESIWLLQLVLAADLLAPADAVSAPHAREVLGAFRDSVVEPSTALITSFDEGGSNRQVWNGAALIAAGSMLGRSELVDQALYGRSGLVSQLRAGLLADGSWYEGENYHLFAHRGLWYGVTMAARLGAALPSDATARFDAGFLAPLATVLPDLTLPSRRDSQYAISLRQPRFAEMAELGFARTGEPVLASLLHVLYDAGLERGETGQRSSTADVERNVAPTALTRADLGWRTLLMCTPALPPSTPLALRSTLQPAQGIAVFRRRAGELYAALDYGVSGGGHGHPDRLNLLLVHGRTRWLDDVGTGSYVERTLHWYRSTLAHNAPLVDGRSQQRVDGTLVAHEERGAAGRVVARAEIAPGVVVVRSVVVLDDYLLDEVHWSATREVTLDLPLHLHGAEPVDPAAAPARAMAGIPGGTDLQDGFGFVVDARVAEVRTGTPLRLHASRGGAALEATIACSGDAQWWRAGTPPAPSAPGMSARAASVELLRQRGRSGHVRTVFSWRPGVSVELRADGAQVTLPDGSVLVHSTAPPEGDAFAGVHRIDLVAAGGRSSIVLDGRCEPARPRDPAPEPPPFAGRTAPVSTLGRLATVPEWVMTDGSGVPDGWFVAGLAESHYRRTEESWHEAGRPAARVAIGWSGESLLVEVAVTKTEPPRFTPADAVNPYDNEHPDIDGDGVQLYLRSPAATGAWILVPDASGTVRVRALAGWGGDAVSSVRWRRTSSGYQLRAELPLSMPPGVQAIPIALDVLVNETARDRERRRGQLVLSGGGGWLYLRGDRHDPARLLPFLLVRET